MKIAQAILLGIGLLVIAHLQGEELQLFTSYGEKVSMDIQPEDRFLDVMGQLADMVSTDKEEDVSGQLILDPNDPSSALAFSFIKLPFFEPKAGISMPPGTRKYDVEPTDAQKSDIRYIVVTLANVPLVKLMSYKSSLESAGDRIAVVHPLKFLEFVFTNEELKVGIRNVKGKGSWVWGDFMDGLIKSLVEESNYDNMKDEFIFDFAGRLEIDPNLVKAKIRERNWKALMDILMSIPRKGDIKRYDF